MPGGEPIECEAFTVQRIRAPRLVAWAGLLVGAALAWFTATNAPDLLGMASYPLMAGALAVLVLHLGGRPLPSLKRAPPARVTVTPRVLTIDIGLATLRGASSGERVEIPRRSLRAGWIESFGGEHKVVLQKRSGDLVWLRVRDEDTARRVLVEVGFDAGHQVWRTQLVSTVAERFTATERDALLMFGGGGVALLAVPFATVAGFAGPIGFVALAVGLLGLGALVMRWLWPRRAVVGTDGVAISGPASKRFIPFTSVRRTFADERGVTLERSDGPPVLLATSPKSGRAAIDPSPSPAAKALLDRVRDAMTAGRLDTEADARYAVLDRGGRSLADWRRDLEALGRKQRKGTGYRSVDLPREELADVVADASAPAERRLAAVLALRTSGDPELAQRLRIAADTCANPHVRVALEKAVTGELEDAELEEALEAERERA